MYFILFCLRWQSPQKIKWNALDTGYVSTYLNLSLAYTYEHNGDVSPKDYSSAV